MPRKSNQPINFDPATIPSYVLPESNSIKSIMADIDRENSENGFFPLPYFLQIVYPYNELKTTDKFVYAHILSYTLNPNSKGCFEARSTIAKKLGLTERKVRESISLLISKKLVESIPTPLGNSFGSKRNMSNFPHDLLVAKCPDDYKSSDSNLAIDTTFVPIYYKVVEQAKNIFPFFTADQIVFYSYLFAHAYSLKIPGSIPSGKIVGLSTDDMMSETGLSNKTVQTYLNDFQKWGIIKVEAKFIMDGYSKKSREIVILCNLLAEELIW